MDEIGMNNKKAIRILKECVNIAAQQYPGVASDYLMAMRHIEKEVEKNEKSL